MLDLDLLDSWDFELPKEQIAAAPLARRGDSRMLTVRASGERVDGEFFDLLDELRAGDVLVFNDTKVLQARLQARRQSGGRVEFLVVGRSREGEWSGDERVFTAMLRSNRRVVEGETLTLDVPAADGGYAPSSRQVTLLSRGDDGLVQVSHDGDLFELLEACGRLPLPPYIEERRAALGESVVQAYDAERYQTVVARDLGAVAAPTAGLHFDDAFLERARAKGVGVERVTLHVGIGTFRPVKTQRLSEHAMHEEICHMSAEVAERLSAARRAGGRVVAVGTTVVRTLESFAQADGGYDWGERATRIFLRPGSVFRGTDALLTNFHLPKSTLLALVAAFVGFEALMDAYRYAVASGYRFFSYGDAMWLSGPAVISPLGRVAAGVEDE